MASRLLPLFPLPVVVFPRTQLPLHIFEDRYKTLVRDAIRDHTEFGIVLAKDNGIVNAGCTVIVDEVLTTYPDGRMDIMTSGRRRFEILMLNEEKEYLQGEVEFFDDDDSAPAPADLKDRALGEYRKLREIVTPQPGGEPNPEDPQLSFQLAQGIEDVDFLSVLLRNRSEAERLRELTDFLLQYVPRQRHITRVSKSARFNGSGKRPAGL